MNQITTNANGNFTLSVTKEKEVVVLRFIEKRGEFTIDDAKNLENLLAHVYEGEPLILLTDLMDRKVSASMEVRKFVATSDVFNELIGSCAILTNMLLVKLTANFLIKINKPKHKMRLFTAENKARVWLKDHLD